MPLWFALSLLGLVAFAAGSFRSAATAGVLLVNWCICTIACRLLIDPAVTYPAYPYLVLAAFDLLAGCAIASLPFNRVQMLVAATYFFGLGWHAWYGFKSDPVQTDYIYARALHSMAWSQLWIVVSWTACDVYRMARRGRYPWRDVLVRWPALHEMVRRR